MKTTKIAYVIRSIMPCLAGGLLLGCGTDEPNATYTGDEAESISVASAALTAGVKSGIGPGSYDLDSKSDLGVFSPATNPTMRIRQSTGSGFNAAASQGSNFCSNTAMLLDGDFNNDQLDDIACVDGTSIKVRKRKSDLTGFDAASTWLTWAAMPANATVLVGDFAVSNSSRKDDVAFYNPSDNSIWVGVSNGSTFATPTRWISGFCGGGTLYVGDYDGDAMEDIACYNPSDGSVRVAKSTGTAFQAPTTWLSSWCLTGGSIHVANYSGDSNQRDDLACVQPNGTVTSVAVSNGTTFTASANWLVSPGFGSNAGTYIGADYTGDGKYDLGFCDSTNNSFKVAVSSGTAFAQPAQWIAPGGIDCSTRVFASGTRDNDSTVGQQTLADWTFMVYLDADNNLSDYAAMDLAEMQTAAASSRVNIIVMLDTYYSDDEFQGDCVYLKVTSGSNGTALKNLGECNMSDWHNMANFASWATAKYPAKRYSLTVWDHGAGWTKDVKASSEPGKSFCVDDHPGSSTGPTSISVANGDWRSALQAMNTRVGRKLDLVAFDACLMAMWEVGAATAPYANYFVASEANIPGTGYMYDGIVAPLVTTPTMNARTLGGLMVSSYNYSRATLALIDPTRIAAVTTAVSNLGTALRANPSQYAAVETIRTSSSVYRFFDEDGYDHFADVGMLGSALNAATGLPTAIRNAGASVNSAVTSAVLQKKMTGSYSNASGLSIYMPALNAHTKPDYYNGAGAVWASAQWDEFLRSFAP